MPITSLGVTSLMITEGAHIVEWRGDLQLVIYATDRWWVFYMSCFSLQNNILRHLIIFVRIDSPSDMPLHMASGTFFSLSPPPQETALTVDISAMDSNTMPVPVTARSKA